ncbi:unnamed protein product [Durusdinium trenchii]|uniref:Uncharacterized protein n=1 Tax=Durusdinium trenchii TaxID=1381693 RepID=A0ABP0N7D3_9DINO
MLFSSHSSGANGQAMAGSLRQISQHKRERLTTKVLPPSYGITCVAQLAARSCWSHALNVFWSLASYSDVEVTTELLNFGLHACERGHLAQQAVELLHSRSPQLPTPDLKSYHLALRAIGLDSARSSERLEDVEPGWPRAVALLEDGRPVWVEGQCPTRSAARGGGPSAGPFTTWRARVPETTLGPKPPRC